MPAPPLLDPRLPRHHGQDMATMLADAAAAAAAAAAATAMESTEAVTPASSSASHLSEEPFCQGTMGGMVMYMEGFHWGLRGGQPCLNLYFSAWTLDTRAKYLTALLGVFLLAVAVEGGAQLRRAVLRRRALRSTPHRRRHRLALTAAVAGRRRLERLWWDHLALPLMHAAQAILGYLLMLAAMTFAVELLLAAVLGLGVGHALFARDARDAPAGTVDPCCPVPPEPTAAEEHDRRGGGAASDEESSPDSTTPLVQPGESHHLI